MIKAIGTAVPCQQWNDRKPVNEQTPKSAAYVMFVQVLCLGIAAAYHGWVSLSIVLDTKTYADYFTAFLALVVALPAVIAVVTSRTAMRVYSGCGSNRTAAWGLAVVHIDVGLVAGALFLVTLVAWPSIGLFYVITWLAWPFLLVDWLLALVILAILATSKR